MKVLINIATVFIAIIVLAAVFRQAGRSASSRNWLCSTALAAESASTKSTESEWVPVRDASLVVPANSSLDFSGLWPSHPAGASGRVMANSEGELAFEKKPTERAKFHCASLSWSPASGSFPDKQTADLYAEQLRVHGYNVARFHFVEAILMTDRDEDFDYDPDQLDRFRYLLAALKRRGIYWIIDAMASSNGAFGSIYPDRWADIYDLRLKIHFDAEARQHWSRLVKTILGTVNPYTKLRPIEDPALALVVLTNENGLEFSSILYQDKTGVAYPPSLSPGFNHWLSTQYGDTEALRAAWGQLSKDESIEDGTVQLPESREERGPRMRDLQSFFRAIEGGTFDWLSHEIRELGYTGLVTQYNSWVTSETISSRDKLPVTSINSYFDEILSFNPGASITQRSSLDDDAGYVREMFGTRWLGKPFVVTEYGHVFWNSFRREAGLLVPAYAALQDWDILCLHGAGAIDLTFNQPWAQKRSLMPYGVGLDPITRADETLAALLFRRGDVSAARTTVAIPFGRPQDMLNSGQGAISSSLTTLGLISRIGLDRADAPASRSDIQLPLLGSASPEKASVRFGNRPASPSRDSRDDRLAENISKLRLAGILSAQNQTNASARVYQSDTDEILVDAPQRLARVITPETEAISFEKISAPYVLGALTIDAASGPALVALSSLDGETIEKSSHLLLIFATDARNTDMKFRDDDQRTIESYGHFPVMIKRERVHLRISPAAIGSWSLTSLHLNGEIGDPLEIAADGSRLTFTLDNTATSHGPTTFFRLDRRL